MIIFLDLFHLFNIHIMWQHVAGYGVATPHILFYLTLSLTARVYHECDTCLLFHHTQALVFESNIYAIVLELSRSFCISVTSSSVDHAYICTLHVQHSLCAGVHLVILYIVATMVSPSTNHHFDIKTVNCCSVLGSN